MADLEEILQKWGRNNFRKSKKIPKRDNSRVKRCKGSIALFEKLQGEVREDWRTPGHNPLNK